MSTQSNQPLPDGYQLNNYTIEKLLSSGGFSIVYLAKDENGTPVAIKEYLPAALVIRADGAEVKINSDENLAVFRHGLKCFLKRAARWRQFHTLTLWGWRISSAPTKLFIWSCNMCAVARCNSTCNGIATNSLRASSVACLRIC